MTESMERFLAEVAKYVPSKKEITLFSLGARGHYENPVSDLLAFFLNPSEDHGLKTIFLESLLECYHGGKWTLEDFGAISIQREETTEKGNRIDILIRAKNWVLIIENKIYHIANNPFDDYELHAKKLDEKNLFKALLSPSEQSNVPGWKAVSYRSFCNVLRRNLRLDESFSNQSKWWVFAREWVIHLENELYEKPMTEDQINFTERHQAQIFDTVKLANDYRNFLLGELVKTLDDAPDSKPTALTQEWKFGLAYRCSRKRWGESDIVWWYDKLDGEIQIRLSVYLFRILKHQRNQAEIGF